ncbi:MAG TPA: ABC transporter substrate-binding protein [Gaiellaceae bacterium]|nr:ABC transporter substrate-binding protein [Gaiellaceae bacterium]
MGRLALVAVLLVLGGTACGERSEPTGPTAPLYPVTIQTGDRPLVVSHAARSIAVFDPAAQTILDGLGVGGRVVLTGSDASLDLREVRRARPDLIIASPEGNERDLSRAASATGARVYTAPGDSIRQVERAITQLGLLTGRPVTARRLVRQIENRRDQVATRLARVPTIRVFVDVGFLNTVPEQSLIGDVLREAHATNVVQSPEPGPVDTADLLRLDPQVYLATSDAEVTLKELRSGQLRKLRAVKAGHFVVADAELLQPGPRIGDGLLQVARLLHPNAFR